MDEMALDEKRKDVLNGQTFVNGLLVYADGFQNASWSDDVSVFVCRQQTAVVTLTQAIYKAFVFSIVLVAESFFEGTRFEVQLRGGVAVVSSNLFGVLVLSFLRDECCVVWGT